MRPHLLLLPMLLVSGCVMNKLDPNPSVIDVRQLRSGTPVTVTAVKGNNYSSRMKAGPLTFNVLPQVVIWTEDTAGHLLETVYITGAGKNAGGHAAKSKKGADFYRESFPVWAQRMTAAGKALPSKKKPYPDAVTSATPMAGFTLHTRVKAPEDSWSLMLEINRAGDDNSAFNKNNNDWVGQPSLVFRAAATDSMTGRQVHMELLGHGGSLHDAPAIYDDLSLIDTALEMVADIAVTIGK